MSGESNIREMTSSLGNRPQICFDAWGQIPSNDAWRLPVPDWNRSGDKFLQNGFHLANDGGAAYEITIESFEIEPSVYAKSKTISRIGKEASGFALVWLDGSPDPDIWNLPAAMAKAWETKFGNPTYAPDYSVRVHVRYKDAANGWYRSSADLRYTRSRGLLSFGPTSHDEGEAVRPSKPGVTRVQEVISGPGVELAPPEPGQVETLMNACAETLAPSESGTLATADRATPAATVHATALAKDRKVFARAGQTWTLIFDGQSTTVIDSKGLRYIADLLRQSGTPCLATDLLASVAGLDSAIPIGSAGEVLDSKAITEYRASREDLAFQLAEAERNNDLGNRERLQAEIDELKDQILSARGLGGRKRKGHDDRDKIRKSVSGAIVRAIRVIRKNHPSLADHLQRHVDCGYTLCYSGDLTWEFQWGWPPGSGP